MILTAATVLLVAAFALHAWKNPLSKGACIHCGARVEQTESECEECYLARQY